MTPFTRPTPIHGLLFFLPTDSIVWEAFDIDRLDPSKSICRFCNAHLANVECDPHGHNSHLRGHLRSMHSDQFELLQKLLPEWILPAHPKIPNKPGMSSLTLSFYVFMIGIYWARLKGVVGIWNLQKLFSVHRLSRLESIWCWWTWRLEVHLQNLQ